MWFEFAKIKGAKIILHVKSPIFRAAKFKGFYSINNGIFQRKSCHLKSVINHNFWLKDI